MVKAKPYIVTPQQVLLALQQHPDKTSLRSIGYYDVLLKIPKENTASR